MPLPKIATPTYELVLPSSDRKIKYRPFLVKEEKILIIAMESEDQKQITNAIKSVINSCILTRGIKVDKLSTFDIEYLFLNIRGKSVGENVEVLVTCPDDNKTQVPVIIPLDEIKIVKNPNHKKDIKLDNDLTMRMKYPSLSEFVKTNFDIDGSVSIEESFELITACVEQIYNEEESWNSSDFTKKEMIDFLDQLNSKQLKEIESFFDTMPKLSHTIKVTNPETKVKNEVVLEGLSSFFE
mgnify:FL=1|tara:strand:+ start:33 stop:752 length:720 start_codon:yes stop_codon:yes gene_type:complete